MKQEATTTQSQEIAASRTSAQHADFLDILIVLAKGRNFILWFTFGVTLLTAIYVFLLPNQYTAETVLMVPAGNSSLAGTLMNQVGESALASVAGLGIKNPGEMYASLFRTRTVEDAVINRFALMARYKTKNMSDARGSFEKHTTVSAGIKDGLLRISVRDTDPKMAADIANGYVEEFHTLSSNLAITEASQRRLFFQQQLSEVAENLAKAEEAMKHTQQTTGVLQIDSQAKSLIESAAMLRAQVTAKQVQIQGLSSYATDDNPEMVTARRQLAELQSQLARLGGNGQDLDPLVVPKGKAPEASMEYINSYRQMKYYETVYDLLAKQFEVAKLDEARQGAIIQVADKATPPDRKSGPHRSFFLLFAFVFGIVLSSVLVLAGNALAIANQDYEKSAKLAAIRRGLLVWR